jgi:hypothetical protein
MNFSAGVVVKLATEVIKLKFLPVTVAFCFFTGNQITSSWQPEIKLNFTILKLGQVAMDLNGVSG